MIEGSVAGAVVRLVLSLATVLMLMVLLARYLRHRQLGTGFGAGATQRRKKAPPLEIVTRQGLSRGSSLAVVRVSGQLLLIGVTESNVSVLRDLEEVGLPEVVSESVGDSAPALGGREFAASLVETMRQWTVRRG